MQIFYGLVATNTPLKWSLEKSSLVMFYAITDFHAVGLKYPRLVTQD